MTTQDAISAVNALIENRGIEISVPEELHETLAEASSYTNGRFSYFDGRNIVSSDEFKVTVRYWHNVDGVYFLNITHDGEKTRTFIRTDNIDDLIDQIADIQNIVDRS